MAPFNYCTVQDAFQYGSSAGNSTDPVNEQAFMAARIIPQVSRAIDRYCQQFFSLDTYTAQILKGVVDRDGVLSCYPSVPTMSAPSDTEYRFGNGVNWLSISGADVEESIHGCTVRFLGVNMSVIRMVRIQVRMTYTGGYADISALPDDLRGAAYQLCWYEFQRRSATQDQTAIPELGITIIPGSWPANIRRTLDHFRKVVAQ